VREYIRQHRDLKDRTLEARVVALKAMLDWAVEEGIIASNPLARMRALSGGKSKGRQKWGGEAAESARALEAEEVEALLDVSAEPYRAMWLCLLTTGMRRGELVKLRWPQADLFKSRITILASTSKTREDRVVPITAELQKALVALRAEALDPEGYVFVNEAGRPWRNNLLKRFKRCAEHALVGKVTRKDGRWHMVYREHGEEKSEPLPEDLSGWRAAKEELLKRRGSRLENVRIHSTRHTFATHLIRQGVDIAVVSKLLGHGSVKTTWDIYHHLLEGDPEKAIARLPFGNGHKDGSNVTDAAQGSDDASQLTA
jgi:integrase